MAKESSFDVVSQVDMNEVRNAVNLAQKELRQRYDFKGSVSSVTLDDEALVLVSDNEGKLRSVVELLQEKLVPQGAAQGTAVRQGRGGARGDRAPARRREPRHLRGEGARHHQAPAAALQEAQGERAGRRRARILSRDELRLSSRRCATRDWHPLQFINYR
jgi:hypothetical protein